MTLIRSGEPPGLDERTHLSLSAHQPGNRRTGCRVAGGRECGIRLAQNPQHVGTGEGGKVGPDLTRIGGVRSERDLLEAIVYPSASFVRSYEPVTVTRLDGRSVSGILKKDAPDEVVVAVSATEEVRIARADIEQVVPGQVSLMPSGLDQQLSPRDLADLVAFLKASK